MLALGYLHAIFPLKETFHPVEPEPPNPTTLRPRRNRDERQQFVCTGLSYI